MSMSEILNIVWIIFTVIFGFLAAYMAEKKEITDKATAFIANAEEVYKDSTKAGGIKFNYVVSGLYNIVPAPLKVIFTQELIGKIVQGIFDKMESYAKTQLDKVVK